jgi:hypothetical protein
MKKLIKNIILFICFAFMVSCDSKCDKLIIDNKQEYSIRLFLLSSNENLSDAIPCGYVPALSPRGIGMVNYKWETFFKDNSIGILYVFKIDRDYRMPYPEMDKFIGKIYITKEELDSLGWKLDYP